MFVAVQEKATVNPLVVNAFLNILCLEFLIDASCHTTCRALAQPRDQGAGVAPV
jgi:hypothetical protein